MSWSTADIPDQSGRVAVVTGANGGLGLETARALAGAGAHVVMAARNQEKAASAVQNIRAGMPDASLEVVALDLGSQASVREAADQILAAHERIDLLVNNAGVMGIPERRTTDGFEMQFGTNHLGHYALTALLMPALLRAPAARIVTVTSTAHHMGRAVDPSNPNLEGKYGPWRAYGQSKLANFHFGLGLDQMLARRRRARREPDRAPGPVEHGPAGRQRRADGRRSLAEVLPHPRRQERHVSRARRAAPVARRHGPQRPRRRVLRASLRQQRAARATPRHAPDRDGPRDRAVVGGLRTLNGAADRDLATRTCAHEQLEVERRPARQGYGRARRAAHAGRT